MARVPANPTNSLKLPASHGVAVGLWLLIQNLSLLLSALEVPFSANFEQPPERLALKQLLVIQVIAAGMLAPFLFRTWVRSLLMILSAAPTLVLAHALAGGPWQPHYIAPLLTLLLWFAFLTIAVHEIRGSPVSAVATLWSVGGVAMYYATAEFSPESHKSTVVTFLQSVFSGPVVAVSADDAIFMPCDIALITVVFSWCLYSIYRKLRARARLSTGFHTSDVV